LKIRFDVVLFEVTGKSIALRFDGLSFPLIRGLKLEDMKRPSFSFLKTQPQKRI
jgi:hypothetical protein